MQIFDEKIGCVQVISRMFKERDGIHCLGLYGMGGSGKTTVCSALCRYFGPDFDKVYHLEIGSNDNGKEKLTKRHKELLRNLIGLSEVVVNKSEDPSLVRYWHVVIVTYSLAASLLFIYFVF